VEIIGVPIMNLVILVLIYGVDLGAWKTNLLLLFECHHM
jgi:hypothetical protein